MSREDAEKAQLYQVMLVTVASALLCFGKAHFAGDAVEVADEVIQAAHSKASKKYGDNR